MKKLHSFIFTFAAAIISAISFSKAYAGNETGAISLTFAEGRFFLASKRNMNNAGVPLVMAAYDFTCHWGIEGLLGMFNTTFKGSVNNPANINREVNATLFAVDGVYHFSPFYHVIEPFILAGVGIMGFNPNNNDANNEGNINAAVGAQFFVNKAVAFRVEARDFYTWVGGKNDLMLDAGVSLLFNLC